MIYFQEKSRGRLWRSCEKRIQETGWKKTGKDAFEERLKTHFNALVDPLYRLYGDQFDIGLHVVELCSILAESWNERPAQLKKQDKTREEKPGWFITPDMTGAVCYADLFNGTLKGVEEKLPYLKDLGITYLHLMPLFKCPETENDGGYAVSSYREVRPDIGTMKDLKRLAGVLRENGILLVLDFINNHTSDEHAWAQKAKEGDPDFSEYYYLFDDRRIPDQFEPHLREIFPEVRRGSFTWNSPPGKWVWTTFHNYQWDLNYRNPAVFAAMVREMLFLANCGVDVLRLDAVPFTWKIAGTVCENLPEAHDIIRALNACVRISAPGMIFKSEAIVHPDDVIEYVAPGKCQVSYNPTVMALLWESLATRETKLLERSLRYRFRLPPGTSWVNYVRSHDDIGWTFSDDDAAALGINGFDHRHFLNQFYSGDFPGSFSKGVRFQFNPENQDVRICGTTASLAGLEKGLELDNPAYRKDAVARILLIYGLTMCIGGIPLIYLGDEYGALNDSDYLNEPNKASDARWVHRPVFDWKKAEKAAAGKSERSDIHNSLRKIIALRRERPEFAENAITLIKNSHPSVLSFVKPGEDGGVIVAANFSEKTADTILDLPPMPSGCRDLISGTNTDSLPRLQLRPYQLCWFVKNTGSAS